MCITHILLQYLFFIIKHKYNFIILYVFHALQTFHMLICRLLNVCGCCVFCGFFPLDRTNAITEEKTQIDGKINNEWTHLDLRLSAVQGCWS